jgi:hypothetical protein
LQPWPAMSVHGESRPESRQSPPSLLLDFHDAALTNGFEQEFEAALLEARAGDKAASPNCEWQPTNKTASKPDHLKHLSEAGSLRLGKVGSGTRRSKDTVLGIGAASLSASRLLLGRSKSAMSGTTQGSVALAPSASGTQEMQRPQEVEWLERRVKGVVSPYSVDPRHKYGLYH